MDKQHRTTLHPALSEQQAAAHIGRLPDFHSRHGQLPGSAPKPPHTNVGWSVPYDISNTRSWLDIRLRQLTIAEGEYS